MFDNFLRGIYVIILSRQREFYIFYISVSKKVVFTKKHTSNKFLRAVASLSCVFLFGLTTNSLLAAADSTNSLGTAAIQAGEEKMMGNLCINGDCTTICDVDGTNGVSKYSVTAQNTNTQFTMFMKEKGKLIAENSFTGQGELPFESRKDDSILALLRN